MTVHFCGVCGQASTHHSAPFWADTTRWFINPCCKGCGCQTYEEALQGATENERAYEEAYR